MSYTTYKVAGPRYGGRPRRLGSFGQTADQWSQYQQQMTTFSSCMQQTGNASTCGQPPIPPGASSWWGKIWSQISGGAPISVAIPAPSPVYTDPTYSMPMAPLTSPGAAYIQPASMVAPSMTSVATAVSPTTTSPFMPGAITTASGVSMPTITDATQIQAQGGIVGGSNMTVQQALTSPGQYSFTRSTDTPGANRQPGFFSDLGAPPPGWNEQKYLANNPDVAAAVKAGAMPSGLWHYLNYGKAENRSFSGFGGWRRPQRPGYLRKIRA